MKEADAVMTRATMLDPTDKTDKTESGLRERKKARTRDALIDNAIRLFSEQGFTATTTEQVAASVEVSQRTFFRYFSCKEEVIGAAQGALDDDFRSRFAAQPAELHPLCALRNAALDTWSALDEQALHTQLTLIQLYEDHPQLLACHFRRCAERESEVIDIIAERTGVDPATDCRPRLVAAAFNAAVTSALLHWLRHSCSGDGRSVIAVMTEHLGALTPALTEPWHTGAAPGTPMTVSP